MSNARPIRTAMIVALAWGAAATAGCNRMTPNPDYKAWSGFAPGSYVTFDGVQETDEGALPVRLTDRLVSISPDQVVLERTIQYLGVGQGKEPIIQRRIEPALIPAAEDARTHPDGEMTELGSDNVEIGGHVYACEVNQLDLLGTLPEFGLSPQKYSGTAWMSPAIPGGLAKIIFSVEQGGKTFGITGEVVDFSGEPMRVAADD